MNAFVQTNTRYHMNKETAKRGLFEMGCVVEEIEYNPDIIAQNPDGIYYGNVGFNNKILEQLGYNQRHIGHVPEDLYHLAGRTIETVSLKEALARRAHESIFIKPVPEHHKKFNGLSFDNPYDLYNVAAYDDDAMVLLSPRINIVSEWRGFIVDDELVDAEHYKGNFRLAPDYYKIENNIKSWKDRPVAWSCDMGITDKGETIIVECNDVLALGWYGVHPSIAGRMLIARWDQIHAEKST